MKTLLLSTLVATTTFAVQAAEPNTIQDKTFVAWVAPGNLTQHGGSVLTIAAEADAATPFDGIIFGELSPAKWMAGSDYWRRTERQQDGWPAETADANTLVQIAMVYRGNEIVAYHNGREYSRHRIKEAQSFNAASLVVIGPRIPGNNDFFAGAIDDARIYDRALTAEEITALKPNVEGAIKPWAWWTFDDAAAKDRTGRFAHTRLTTGAKVENGRLLLDGLGGSFFAAGRAELIPTVAAPAAKPSLLTDKTLIVWVAPANLTQQAGSALSIEDGQAHFDGIVFGEIAPKKWMPGSDSFRRTMNDQMDWPDEIADGEMFIQIAIVYRGREVTVLRNGHDYARYTMPNPPQVFGPEAVVLFGRRHSDAEDTDHTFAGRIKDARIYDKALDRETIDALQPGKIAGDLKPWAWWSFADEGLREKTGRFTEIKLLGDVRIEDGSLVLGGKGATVITTCFGDNDAKPVSVPKTWSFTGAVPDEAVRSTRLLRERFLADPYRPTYHFCVPEDMGAPGDPNGAFYHNGRYHLMYLYNRNGSGFCWGHISSADLVHWRHHPDAIGPGNGDEGCFSGGAFVDDNGTAYLSYWMLPGDKGIGLAKSQSPDFDSWTKLDANPVIKATENGATEAKDQNDKTVFYGCADPSNIWKKNGHYYMLTGNLLVLNKIGRAPDAPLSEQGDRLYLFVSDDLKNWKYLHVFYQRKTEWTDRSEDNMCPSFLPLPSSPAGGPPSGKHLLLFISHNKGCQYYIGDYRNDLFTLNNHGRMSWVDNTYFAPEALMDGQGRQIMWAWLTDNPPGEKEKGWSGVYGLPRSLWLGDDGTLRLQPVKELETLRCHEKSWNNLTLANGETKPLEGIVGDSCELGIEIEVGTARRCGVKVRASADGAEETLLYYDTDKKELAFDSTRSGGASRQVVERAPFALKPGELLKLRVFVDKCVVEIFANDRQAIGRRVYPTRPDSLGVSVFATGGTAKIRQVKAWQMAPSNPY